MLFRSAKDRIIKAELKELVRVYSFSGLKENFKRAVDEAVYWHIERRAKGDEKEIAFYGAYWDKIKATE